MLVIFYLSFFLFYLFDVCFCWFMVAKIDNISSFNKLYMTNMPLLCLHHSSSPFVGAALSANYLCIIQCFLNFNY